MMLAFLLHLLLTTGATVDGADWPSWRGPNHDGISPETGWSSDGADEPLWTASVGRGYSSVAVADGRLFTRGFYPSPQAETTPDPAPAEPADGEATEPRKPEVKGTDVTVCLDALTGAVIWTHESPSKLWDNMHRGGTLTTPVVDGDTVYVLSRLGPLTAHEFADGSVRWQRPLADELGVKLGFFGLSSSPLLVDDLLYLNVGKTVALDKKTGETIWETRDYGYSYATPVAFSWEDRPLLAVFNAEGLSVLDRRTGEEVASHAWTSNYNVNSASPIVIGDKIFISTGYDEKGCALLELTEEGLDVEWATRSMNNKMNGCVYVDGAFYGFDGGKLKCVDIESEQHWVHRGLGKGTLIASDGRLIVLGEKGELRIAPVSREGFEPEYECRALETEDPCWTTPVLARGLIYCRDGGGQLVCLDHRGS